MESIVKTQIVAEKGKQELFITREFDAPRELVFKAFSTPEIMVQFHAPYESIMTFDYADYRSGGSYRWLQHDASGTLLCSFSGVIHELTTPERIIQTAEFEQIPEKGHVVLEALLFEALNGNRTKLIIHEVCRSVEDRDAMVASGMLAGLEIVYNQLDELLKTVLI